MRKYNLKPAFRYILQLVAFLSAYKYLHGWYFVIALVVIALVSSLFELKIILTVLNKKDKDEHSKAN